MKKIIKLIKKPSLLILYLMNKGVLNWLNDETFLKIKYRLIMKKKLNLENPKTFNEKLQWLKLYDRKDIYTTMVDKYEAKKYVAKIIGEEYIIPTIGIYNSFEEIDFNKLPNQFVIKPTHTSGDIYICKDKNKIDYKKLNKEVNRWLKRKYYYFHREWPYKNVKPRIIIEKYMEDADGTLKDYKVYAFNGKCNYVMACIDRIKKKTKFFYFDKQWKLRRELSNDGKKYGNKYIIKAPINLVKMFDIAAVLSEGITFIRIDFYEVNEKLYFGELTFYPSAGFDVDRTIECDDLLSNSLDLEECK